MPPCAGLGLEFVGAPQEEYANRLGWHNAVFLYHKGMIEASLGDKKAARVDLVHVLAQNPAFNPLQVPVVKSTLTHLRDAS